MSREHSDEARRRGRPAGFRLERYGERSRNAGPSGNGSGPGVGAGGVEGLFDSEGRLRRRRNDLMPATRELAGVIRAARKRAKMSLRELARRTWLPKSTCARAETEGAPLAVEALVRIGAVLGLGPSLLLTGTENPVARGCPI